MNEEQTEPCPSCHKENKLTKEEAANPKYVCDECYAQIGASLSEGMFSN